MSENYITDLDVTNLKGIEHLTIKMGRYLTVIHAENGRGKTSCIDALRAAFKGGHHPELIRTGQKKALVAIKLKSGHTIERHISPKTSRLEITGPDGKPVPETEQAFVEKLAAGFAFDPLALLKADKKERQKFIADATPVVFDPAEFGDALKGTGIAPPSIPSDLQRWKVLDAAVREERRKANGNVEDKQATITSLSEGLGDSGGTVDWEQEAKERAHVHDKLAGERTSAIRKSEQVLQDEILRLQRVEQEEIAGIRERYKVLAEEARNLHKQEVARLDLNVQPKITKAKENQLVAEEKARAQMRSRGARETIDKMRAELQAERKKAEALDAAVKALDALRLKKLAEQPVPCEIRDGEIFVDGIPFDELNKARQINLCLQLGALKTGELGFMVMDELEAFSPKTMAKFEQDVRESGFQILGAKVSSAETLTVEAKS